MEQQSTTPRKLWEHPDPKSTEMWKFMQRVNKNHNRNFQARLPRHTLLLPSLHLMVSWGTREISPIPALEGSAN